MTDGQVGNDMAIISEVQKYQNARVFAFGIGEAPNRFLLDKMAEAGRGEVEYVLLNDDGSAAARRFHERVRNPLLTDISIDWNGLPVADVYPQRIPDLFGAKPVVLTGRYSSPGQATIRLKGKVAGNDFSRDIAVSFPETMASHDVLASLWARSRIDNLMAQDYEGVQANRMRADLKETITQLGIEYRLMTQFTSFVAVEEMIVTEGGQPRRVDVPVEVPAGTVPQETSADANVGFISQFYLRRLPAARGMSSAGLKKARPTPPNAPPVVTSIRVLPGAAPSGSPELADSTGTGSGIGKDFELRQKLHASVLAVIERLRNKQSTGEYEFIRDGKAEVQIWLTDKSDETLAKLKELGFEVMLDPKTSKVIIGRVPIQKLEELVTLKFVRYVAPQAFK
jgi:Ca-activated chloride channel family protein